MRELDGEFKPTEPPMNSGAMEVVEHFKKIEAHDELAAIDAELKVDLPNPLDFSTLSEDLCGEIAEAQNMAEFWDARLKALKDQAKRLAGKERGLLPYGDYALEIKESKGRKSVDYKQYIVDNMTKAALEECESDPKYVKNGEPVVSLSVKKLR